MRMRLLLTMLRYYVILFEMRQTKTREKKAKEDSVKPSWKSALHDKNLVHGTCKEGTKKLQQI